MKEHAIAGLNGGTPDIHADRLPGSRSEKSTGARSGMNTAPIQPRSSQTARSQPRYKMAVARWLALFPLLVVNAVFVAPLLATIPSLLRVLLVSIVIVALMTWVTMPLVTKWLRFWLLPSNQSQRRPDV